MGEERGRGQLRLPCPYVELLQFFLVASDLTRHDPTGGHPDNHLFEKTHAVYSISGSEFGHTKDHKFVYTCQVLRGE